MNQCNKQVQLQQQGVGSAGQVGGGVGVGGAARAALGRGGLAGTAPLGMRIPSPGIALSMPTARLPFQNNLVGPPGPSPNQVNCRSYSF